MIQEIAVADMQPSVKTCSLYWKVCKTSAFYTAMIFPTTDLFSKPLKTLLQKQLKMIISGYLLFLEDVFPIYGKIPRRKWYAKNPA